ncbi:hypothetical protein B0A49_01006 [Cryomyces minteri]|uniref:Uncharacterized protein n=1 Tax=Cryomyces minteri TaxID=331657 RepID=A0A4V5NJV3_9PEZI|nr:hypothetical protein B0A49_01006 [Cryomyces minteri]
MKRKFSLGLPPLKFGPSKSDTEALKEVLASQNVPPSPSPMIVDRRPLSPQTELELRQSCATILQDFKPSSQLYEEQLLAQRAKPLDYNAIKSSVRPMGSDHTGRKGSRFNPNDLPEVFHTPEGREDNPYAYKPKTALEDLFPEQDSTHELIKANMSRRMEQPRTIPAQPPPTARTMSKDDRMDKHDSGKIVKHRTLSGDHRVNGSTMGCLNCSDLRSTDAVSKFEAQTTKRSVNLNRELPPLPGLDKWKETEQELEPQPVATNHIANLMSSTSKSGTRPKVSTAASNTETRKAPAREHKSHIVEARLGEPIQIVKSKPRSNAASRSDYQLPMRPGTAKPTPATTQSPPNPDYGFDNIASTPTASAKKTWRRSTAPDFPSELTSRPSTTTNARNGPLRDASNSNSNSTRHSPSHSHSHSQQGAKDKSLTHSRRTSLPPARPESATNFSRKLSTDTSGGGGGGGGSLAGSAALYDPKYPNVVEISALRSASAELGPGEERKRFWTALFRRKEREMTWMDRIEQMGVKDGIMLEDEIVGTPIVRF